MNAAEQHGWQALADANALAAEQGFALRGGFEGEYNGVGTFGTTWKRKVPQGDAFDAVTLVGADEEVVRATVDGQGFEDFVGVLVIQPATFGPNETISAEDFVAEYRRADPAELALLAAEQATEARASDEKNAKNKQRISPWRRG